MAIQIGRWRVDWVTDGEWRLDGGGMYGRVPRVLWERLTPPDEFNRVRLTCRMLVLRSHDACVLVDAGLGRMLPPKLADQVGISPKWELLTALKNLGVHPDNVNYVILSHLHFDHVGGCIRQGDGGVPSLTFPKARYLVQRGEWEDAHTDNVLLRRSYVPETLSPLAEAGVIEFLDGSGEVLPGVHVQVTGGHTAYHQMIVVTDGGMSLAYPADLMPLVPHVNPAWVLGFDAYPLDSVSRKTAFLDQAERESWHVVLNHDPDHACGHIIRDPNGRFIWSDE